MVRLVTPAWLVEVIHEDGTVKRYCVDAFFLDKVSVAFRRLLLVYPESYCTDLPPEEGVITPGGLEASMLQPLLQEACDVARETASTWKPSLFRLMLLLPPSRDEERGAEAFAASRLCETLFGERVSARIIARRFIVYNVGDKRDARWRRLNKLARQDRGISEALRLLGENLGFNL